MDTVTLDRRLSQPAKEFLHQPSRLLSDCHAVNGPIRACVSLQHGLQDLKGVFGVDEQNSRGLRPLSDLPKRPRARPFPSITRLPARF